MHCVQSGNWHGKRQPKRARVAEVAGESPSAALNTAPNWLSTLQWNCTEIFLIISEQQRVPGNGHNLATPLPRSASLFQLLSQLCVYIKSMKCNNVMSNCAKVIRDTMRSYAKNSMQSGQGYSGITAGKTARSSSRNYECGERERNAGRGRNKSCQRQQQQQLKQRPAWGSTTHGGVACGRTCNVAVKS